MYGCMLKFSKIHQLRHALFEAEKHGVRRVVYQGTTKIHGANTSVVLSPSGEIVDCQSRNIVLDEDNDAMGFRAWATHEDRRVVFRAIMSSVRARVPGLSNNVVIYGEWCGPGIQRNVAVNDAKSRMWWVFEGVLDNDDRTPVLESYDVSCQGYGLYHVVEAGAFITSVSLQDENSVNRFVARLSRCVESTERSCPVGKFLGLDGCGEGMVFVPLRVTGADLTPTLRSKLRFKVKGEKHKATKPKTIREKTPEDLEAEAMAKQLANRFVSEPRMQQAMDWMVETSEVSKGDLLTTKHLGSLIRWINTDIEEEELDLIEKSAISMKDIKRPVSNLVRAWVAKHDRKRF